MLTIHEKGNKVKYPFAKGRMITHKEIGAEVLADFAEATERCGDHRTTS